SERWNTSSGELNISTFEAGVYVVRVMVNGQSAHLRLVKQ
ncbi:MAG: T9SS type A sorting domain-containing protein, partial [Flavobacteriales bacterium]